MVVLYDAESSGHLLILPSLCSLTPSSLKSFQLALFVSWCASTAANAESHLYARSLLRPLVTPSYTSPYLFDVEMNA